MDKRTKDAQQIYTKLYKKIELDNHINNIISIVLYNDEELGKPVQKNKIIPERKEWTRANKARFLKNLSTQKSNDKVLVTKAPGHLYISLAKIILTKRSYARIMKPSILMMQEEYFENYQKGNIRFAFFVKVRFSFIFLFILGLNFPLIKQLLEIKEKIAK